MDSNGFYDIEDFEIAYKERLYEYKFIEEKSSEGEFRILLMHLGGIILECYIKSIIINKKNITKSRSGKRNWYSQEYFEYITQLKQCERKAEFDKRIPTEENPGHKIRDAICKISILNQVLNDRNDIEEDIRKIQNPFDDEREFIDLRYSVTEDNEYTENVFKEWKESFINVYKWITYIIEVEEG
ncbi:hypothetical protein ACV3Z6_09645 [Clostridium perfringens]|uniref:hypothetical protein n=1 Tax=Clostridium perfringens TaxID=1502 RepID=UPI001A2FBB97|nr:hypothetical protein [Clostridium perfringens]MDN4555517.1 hypothetical protein [Clostridium perfringens]MDT7987181.1 hypothetical protein [Clostridium perfringens]WVM60182.1 hypothetical protein V1657_12480 [Clostridium perfringens]HAT4182593.1 hypothetical protein [Clostridium perfringens]